MSFTDYAAAEGVTPTSPYIAIINALVAYYEEKRPNASMEQVEEWADSHAARWAGPVGPAPRDTIEMLDAKIDAVAALPGSWTSLVEALYDALMGAEMAAEEGRM
jgi:hypothetical protein